MRASVARLTDAVDLLDRLVAFPTISSTSNLDLIAFVRSFLDGFGVESTIVPNAAGDKAALFATFGPKIDGGVVLSGHTDVVPVAGQAWTSDPFRLVRRGDQLFGRGACDMKGFVAVALAMAPEFQGAALRRPIHLLLSYDEETTCLGCIEAIRRFGADFPRPECVIVGEPTTMRPSDAHKGIVSYVTRVTGRSGHSSNPERGASAIEIACALVGELYRIGGEIAHGSDRFDPPGSSISVGVIEGGSARNVIAERCRFDWEFRGEPDADPRLALRRLERFLAQASGRLGALLSRTDVETSCEVEVPGLRPEPGGAAEQLLFHLTGANSATAAPFATEAGRFQAAGLSTALCGPGDIQQAHQPDEYVELEQLAACIRLLRALAAHHRS